MTDQHYVIGFLAINALDLEGDEQQRLDQAARTMPGIRVVGTAEADPASRSLRAQFSIPVEQAMAEAARDGGRLAKEILLSARIPDARLVEMTVRMVDPSHQ